MNQELLNMIKDCAERYGIRAVLIQAICEAESSYNPKAMKYEPGYNWTYKVNELARCLKITPETEEALQRMSFGLMQVMGAVAREYGFSGHLTDLLDAQLGLSYGCKHLKRLTERHGEERKVIAAYNAGSPRYRPDKVLFVNQPYVDKVSLIIRRLEKS